MEVLGSAVARAALGASRAAGWVLGAVLAVGLSACGGVPDEYASTGASLQLTSVWLAQYAPLPTPIPGSPELPSRLVTVDVTLIFVALEKPATLVLTFTSPSSGSSENRIDLGATSIANSLGGRQTFRTLVTIPDLDVLHFDAALIDRAGAVSATVSGRFTVEDSLTVTQSGQSNESNQITTQNEP